MQEKTVKKRVLCLGSTQLVFAVAWNAFIAF